MLSASSGVGGVAGEVLEVAPPKLTGLDGLGLSHGLESRKEVFDHLHLFDASKLLEDLECLRRCLGSLIAWLGGRWDEGRIVTVSVLGGFVVFVDVGHFGQKSTDVVAWWQ